MVLPLLYTPVKGLGCQPCELQAAMSCELVVWHFSVSCSYELSPLYYTPSLSCAAWHLSRPLSQDHRSCYYIYYYKKNKPHFIIPQIMAFVNRVLRAGIKRETIISQLTFILLRRGRTYILLCELSIILTSQRAGFEIIGGAALFLYLLKKTIFRMAPIFIFPLLLYHKLQRLSIGL